MIIISNWYAVAADKRQRQEGGLKMVKTKKTYSMDEQVIARLNAIAQAQGVSASSMLAIIINQAAEKYLPQQQPAASK